MKSGLVQITYEDASKIAQILGQISAGQVAEVYLALVAAIRTAEASSSEPSE